MGCCAMALYETTTGNTIRRRKRKLRSITKFLAIQSGGKYRYKYNVFPCIAAGNPAGMFCLVKKSGPLAK
jgi:hypothetical protein